MRRTTLFLVPILALGLASCSERDHDHDHDHEVAGAHHHTAPHGGTLVKLGDEFLHLEVVLDAKSGELTAYVLDGEAEEAVRLAQAELELSIDKDGTTFSVKLAAHASTLTGETVGDSSEFRGQSDTLVGADRFHARVVTLQAKGQNLAHVEFDFPAGNE